MARESPIEQTLSPRVRVARRGWHGGARKRFRDPRAVANSDFCPTLGQSTRPWASQPVVRFLSGPPISNFRMPQQRISFVSVCFVCHRGRLQFSTGYFASAVWFSHGGSGTSLISPPGRSFPRLFSCEFLNLFGGHGHLLILFRKQRNYSRNKLVRLFSFGHRVMLAPSRS